MVEKYLKIISNTNIYVQSKVAILNNCHSLNVFNLCMWIDPHLFNLATHAQVIIHSLRSYIAILHITYISFHNCFLWF